MKRLVLASVGLALMMVQTAHAADIPYPTIDEMYNDCKAAVKLADKDIKGFLHTNCAGRMYGLWNGITYIGIVVNQPSLDESQAQIAEVSTIIKRRLSTKFCLDMNQSKPAELVLAKDFIAYIDQLKADDSRFSYESFRDSSSPIALVGFLNHSYSCKTLNAEPQK